MIWQDLSGLKDHALEFPNAFCMKKIEVHRIHQLDSTANFYYHNYASKCTLLRIWFKNCFCIFSFSNKLLSKLICSAIQSRVQDDLRRPPLIFLIWRAKCKKPVENMSCPCSSLSQRVLRESANNWVTASLMFHLLKILSIFQ